MIYWFLSICMRLALKVYFKKIEVVGLENLPKDKPILLTPNHPSGFMDPMLIAALVNRPVHFISRGESFVKPFQRWFFSKLHMLPVYRPDKTKHLVHKNKDVFKSCYKILEKNGAIIIFPEGLSHMAPRLIKTKTGAARIALGAENDNNFELDVHIVPVGLNYSNAHKFRSSVCVHIGQSIPVKTYESTYRTQPQETARNLTDRIRQSIIQNSVHIYDENRFKSHQMLLESGIYDTPSYAGSLSRINELSQPEINILNKALYELYDIKNQLNLKNHVNQPVRWKWYQLMLTPFALLGACINYIPFKLTGIFTDNIIKRPDFRGSFLLVSGFFIFLMFYLSGGILLSFEYSWITGFNFIVIAIICGLGWLSFSHQYKQWKSYRAYQKSQINQLDMHKKYCRIVSDIKRILSCESSQAA